MNYYDEDEDSREMAAGDGCGWKLASVVLAIIFTIVLLMLGVK